MSEKADSGSWTHTRQCSSFSADRRRQRNQRVLTEACCVRQTVGFVLRSQGLSRMRSCPTNVCGKGRCADAARAEHTRRNPHPELLMSRNEIDEVLTLEDSETVLRHRRGAIEALLTSHAKIHKPAVKRSHRDGDDRHERYRSPIHAVTRDQRV